MASYTFTNHTYLGKIMRLKEAEIWTYSYYRRNQDAHDNYIMHHCLAKSQ